MKVKIEDKAFIPCRAHKTDAGLDLKTPNYFCFFGNSRALVDTGVHVALPEGTFGLIAGRSSLNKKGIVVNGGIIDQGYVGSIGVQMINTSEEDIEFEKGDRIAQLIVIPCRYEEVEIVEELPLTDRKDKGFGSTGR